MPQQPRGRKRVEGLLRAAASVIAETGYERATMCAIAGRAGACIGSLYQFFPNKESVAEALRAQYSRESEALWKDHAMKAKHMKLEDLVSRMVDSLIHFAESHPAYLALLDAPSTSRTWQRRRLMRNRIARVLRVRKPAMPAKKIFLAAAVVQQIFRALLTLYARSTSKGEKGAILEEFKVVLTSYLHLKLVN